MTLSERYFAASYNSFGGLGSALLRLFRGLPMDLSRAGMHIHPEAYLSGVLMGIFTTLVASIASTVLLLPFFGLISFTALAAPAIIFLILLGYPRMKASSITSGLEAEVPYAAAYISVMAAGGISPYKSIQRLKNAEELLANLATEAKRVDIEVRAFGIDPVAAIENSAKRVPSKEYADLLLGYASTLRVGGDVVHYLHRRVEMIFRERLSKIKLVGERIAMLMEAYIAFSSITALTFYVIFIIARAFPNLEGGFATPATFVLFVWVLMPMVAVFFVYLVDVMQPKYPRTYWPPNKVMKYSIILAAILYPILLLPKYLDIPFLNTIPLHGLLDRIRIILGLQPGYSLSVSLSVLTLVVLAPTAFSEIRYGSLSERMVRGMTSFLRDLVEIRKTGLSPERCIINLTHRSYGVFNRILTAVAVKLMLGIPYREIYLGLRRRVSGWITNVNLFLLVDVIDVGGGTPETLEALARFSEETQLIERERVSMMRPLILLPYISSLVILGTALVMIYFVRALMLQSGRYFAYNEFIDLFVPPIVFMNIFSGLVAGKVSSERVSGGFKHAFILTGVTLLAFVLSTYLEPWLTPSPMS
ncbi:MAG: type II secretion system F family protein [Nitrososphaerota archaeon]